MRSDDSGNHWLTSGNGAQLWATDERQAKSLLTIIQLGRFQDAVAVLSELRARYSTGTVPRMMIRILLVEACLQYYKDRSPQALDRSSRAQVLSEAYRFLDLEAEAAIWSALFCFNFDKYSQFGRSLLAAFRGFHVLSDPLRARFCLLIADSFQFFGDFSISDKWYVCARIFSRRTGERPLMAAIEYNRIVMALSSFRLARFVDRDLCVVDRRNWVEEIRSVRRLHEGLQIEALDELLLFGESLAREFSGDFLGGVEFLEKIRNQGAAGVCGLSDRQLDLEIVWCRVLGGDIESVSESSLPSLDEVGEWTYGEQVVGLPQLEEISRVIGIPFDTDRCRQMHLVAINHCQMVDRELRAVLDTCRSMFEQIEPLALRR